MSRPLRVLELGSVLAVSYAGMILAEQGHRVTKWTAAHPDLLQGHRGGQQLWAWLQHGKTVQIRHASTIAAVPPGEFDVVIENHRADTWRRWGVDPAQQARGRAVAVGSARRLPVGRPRPGDRRRLPRRHHPGTRQRRGVAAPQPQR